MTDLQRKQLEADHQDDQYAENMLANGFQQCQCCAKFFPEDKIIDGRCPEPVCRQWCTGCGTKMEWNTRDSVICPKCHTIHKLENGEWRPI